ncbi:predicted esterase of the alpha-beta hydrolase superfamily [Clostridium sp. CAG:354]|jgi:NTE family protein|nr:patatin-like phospholipase family protein [Clostridium sp.]MEE0269511.1 patatin-like phospholipase family protein [Clostridia bacterium]CDE10787.1 predicted esterase of the alpha-beta hydrolase superfamily [Clostridium sp. CAG:354]
MKLGLCLSGGGIKGVAHIGAIKALEEKGIKFDYVSGTSSGSIIATLYACGFTTDEMYKIFTKYAKSIRYIDFENIKRFFKNIFTGRGVRIDGLNSGIKIKKLVREVCMQKGIKNIKQIKMPILIPAVDIYTDELCVFSNNINKEIKSRVNYINDIDIGTAVQASCSYPGIFSPCPFNNKLFVDGGITENLPCKETKKAGANKVLSIVFEDKEPKKCCNNIFEIINKSFSLLCKELARYELDGTDYLLKIKTNRVGLLEKSKMQELYEEGYIQTKKMLQNNILIKLKYMG